MDENTSQGGFETTTATEEGIQASDVLQQAEGIETMAESEPTPETLVKAEETETEEVPKVDESKPEEDKKFAARFAALSRKEKALREREAQVNERMQQLEAQIAKMQESKEPEPEPEMPWDQMLEEDPLNALKKKGLSYEELTRIVMNDGKLTPEMQLRLIEQKMDRKYSAEIQKLREEREQEKESAETKILLRILKHILAKQSQGTQKSTSYWVLKEMKESIQYIT